MRTFSFSSDSWPTTSIILRFNTPPHISPQTSSLSSQYPGVPLYTGPETP